MNTTATTPASKPQKFYDKTLLAVLRQTQFVHQKFAQKRPMPKNYGDTVSFRQIGKLSVATTPLTEGTAPAGSNASVTEITATTAQYGKVA